MKKILLLIAAIIVVNISFSQVIIEPRINVALGAVGIINPGVEFGVSNHSAVQMEFLGSFAEKNYLGSGYPFLVTAGFCDYRYYIKESMKGFFVGTSLGFGTWKLSRNMIPFAGYAVDRYDVGQSLFLGATVGYKFLIKERWGIEISLSGGWAHSNHEGYNKHGVLVVKSNRSDEFIPYKGGVYLTYRLGGKKK